jgi:phosphoglycolate phosphatase-like HAD superfamily hydrolase
MTKLKALLFALDNVVFINGAVDAARMHEFGRLIKYLTDRDVRPIVFANRSWTVTTKGQTESARTHYSKIWGPKVKWYIADEDGFPKKPQADSLKYVLKKEGLTANEVVFLGNDEDDMRVAVNGNVLFLTAGWLAKPTDYGFQFESVKDVARFIDLFCLREHLWF